MKNKKIIKDLRKELFVAIEKYDFQEAKEVIKLAKSMKVKEGVLDDTRFGMPPVHFAVEKDSIEILELLLKNDANIDNSYGKHLLTSLHIAARDGKVEVGKLLLKYRAYINAKDTRYQTPLHLASSHCQLDMVEFLLANEADVNIQDQKNRTALNVVGDEVTCSRNIRKEISLTLKHASRVTSEVNVPKGDAMKSSAVKPSSFINSVFSWMGTSTTAALSSLFQSAPALPPAQQSVDHLYGSPISSSQVDCNGIILLTAAAISKFTGKRYSMPLDNSLLTIRQVKERKLNSLERDVKMALSKCDKLYQYPESSLSNFTISKGVSHQRPL